MVLSHPELPWSYLLLSKNPNITMDMVLSHPDIPWDWRWLSENNMKKGKEKYIREKVYELKLIDEFKLISHRNNLFPKVIEDIIIEYFN
jgi:hypothetical protein